MLVYVNFIITEAKSYYMQMDLEILYNEDKI